MAYVPVPKDLSKIKTKLAFNLTKRQLVCFSGAAAVGLPAYLFSRGSIGNSAAMFLMIGLMLPSFGCAWCPLPNRRKTGCKAELFLKNPKNYFEGFFSGASRISRVWGRHSPTRFPQGQNERKANFGTAVESCSKKLPLSAVSGGVQSP